MKYMTTLEAANIWGVTERRVLALCASGRVEGAEKFGWSWAIPVRCKKPVDARRKDEPPDIDSFEQGQIVIERVWAMPNSRTFTIKPIKELILSEMTEGLWIDPFANQNKLATITNDLNKEFDTDYHLDALDFLKIFEDNSVDRVLYDPPYSPRQVSECYNNVGYNVTWDTTKASFWGNHKREISRIVKQDGKVITFGWNSGGIGMNHGFEIKRILLVPHGGWHNDTICTVEAKTKTASVKSLYIPAEQLRIEVECASTNIDEELVARLRALPVDFWDFKNTNTHELTHGLHNYPAVMVSPISRNILKIVQSLKPVETLLDPFSGSGTVLVEGVVAGVKTVLGNDLNPLARLMSQAKTIPLSPERLERLHKFLIMKIESEMAHRQHILDEVDNYIMNARKFDITAKDGWGSDAPKYLASYLSTNHDALDVPMFKNIGYWYRPQVIIALQLIKDCIAELPDGVERNFAWVAFSEIARTMSNRRNGEFKMFRMPAEKILKFRPMVKDEFADTLKRNINKMSDFFDACAKNNATPHVRVLSENTTVLNAIDDNSVDLMITSPPYGDSRTTVAYGEFSRLSLQWL